MRLSELKPRWYVYRDVFEGHPGIAPPDGNFGDPYHHVVLERAKDASEAQGISILCPACFRKNGGEVGTHRIQVGFEGRGLLPHQGSQNREGKPSRWQVSGIMLTDFESANETLTLSPSIDCGCWHGFIKNGDISDA